MSSTSCTSSQNPENNSCHVSAGIGKDTHQSSLMGLGLAGPIPAESPANLESLKSKTMVVHNLHGDANRETGGAQAELGVTR